MSDDEARAFFEACRWPHGPRCVFCDSRDVYRLGSRRGQRKGKHGVGMSKRAPDGLWRCLACDGHGTVTVGTIMESSKLPLSKWYEIIERLTIEPMNAHLIHKRCDLTYKTAWFLSKRLRYAMDNSPRLAANLLLFEGKEGLLW